MKKIVSVLLAVLMLCSMMAFAVNAAVVSFEGVEYDMTVTPKLNGNANNSLTLNWSQGDNSHPVLTVESKDYAIDQWALEGLKEGRDFKFLSKNNKKVVIEFLQPASEAIVLNAISKAAPNYNNGGNGKSPTTGAQAGMAMLLIAAGITAAAVSLKKKLA